MPAESATTENAIATRFWRIQFFMYHGSLLALLIRRNFEWKPIRSDAAKARYWRVAPGGRGPGSTGFPEPSFTVWTISTAEFSNCSNRPLGHRT